MKIGVVEVVHLLGDGDLRRHALRFRSLVVGCEDIRAADCQQDGPLSLSESVSNWVTTSFATEAIYGFLADLYGNK